MNIATGCGSYCGYWLWYIMIMIMILILMEIMIYYDYDILWRGSGAVYSQLDAQKIPKACH